MKLSELIKQYQTELKENGDIEVVFNPSTCEDVCKLGQIIYNPITNQLEIWID